MSNMGFKVLSVEKALRSIGKNFCVRFVAGSWALALLVLSPVLMVAETPGEDGRAALTEGSRPRAEEAIKIEPIEPKLYFYCDLGEEVKAESLRRLREHFKYMMREHFENIVVAEESGKIAMVVNGDVRFADDVTWIQFRRRWGVKIDNQEPFEWYWSKFESVIQEKIDARKLGYGRGFPGAADEMIFIISVEYPFDPYDISDAIICLSQLSVRRIIVMVVRRQVPVDPIVPGDGDTDRSVALQIFGNLSSTTPIPRYRPDEKPFDNVPYEVPPTPIGSIRPRYPDFARRAGVEGTVILEVEVYKDGTIRNIDVSRSVQSGPGGVDEAAIEAVRKLRFQPGTSGGQPVDTSVIIRVMFRIN